MSDQEESSATKRAHEPDNAAGDDDESSDGWVGPLPSDAAPTKKRKGNLCHLSTYTTSYTLY